MAPIRVLIADDHVIAREGLKNILLNAATDMEIVGIAETIDDVLRKLDALRPDVMLLDLSWYEDKHVGLKVIEKTRKEFPEIQIVAISVYHDLIDAAQKLGAHGLNKGFTIEQLLDSIRMAVVLKDQKARQPTPGVPISTFKLTERETEVLSLLVNGCSDKEIADTLMIAESTVNRHLTHIFSKLAVQGGRKAVMVMARENRWFEST
jgi:DNA-binding NarL/FixJ family response regulator